MRNSVLVASICAAAIVSCTERSQTDTPDVAAAPPRGPVSATPPAAEPTAESMAGAEPEAMSSWPDQIVAARNQFIPEGVEFDSTRERFLLGSVREGTVFELGRDGALTAFAQDPELRSSVGIEVDEERGRLLVANSDASVFASGGPGHAKLAVFDLATGERLQMLDLGALVSATDEKAVFFANDVTVDARGFIYVTDSRSGSIYQVDDQYAPSLLRRFDAETELIPNGLVAHPDGYLLVAGGTRLYKVPLAKPGAATPVALPTEIDGADGVVWLPDGRLAIVANRQNRVVALTSSDGWRSAELTGVASYEVMASTAAVVGGEVYVVHPHFRDEGTPSVERVRFE